MSSPFDEPSKFEVVPPTEVRVSLRAGSTGSAPVVHVQGTPENVAAALHSEDMDRILTIAADRAAGFEKTYAKARDRMDSLAADRTLGKPDNANKPVDVEMPFQDDVKTCKHGVMTRTEHKGQVGYVCKLDKKDPERCPSIMVN